MSISTPSLSSTISSRPFLAGAAAGVALSGVALLGKWAIKKWFKSTPPKSHPKHQRPIDLTTYTPDGLVQLMDDEFPHLIQAFIDDSQHQYDMPPAAIQRLHKLFNYTIPGGKYYRGIMVLNTVQTLCKEYKLDVKSRGYQAVVLAWCIEILQACFLVADDLMDKSITRRGRPCWYRLPEVQNDAVNDSLILESLLYFLLRTYCHDHPSYDALVYLYQSVSLQTQLGQMLDLTSQPQGAKNPEILNGFTLETYTRIVTYKTAIYTFYLPTASGMILCGFDTDYHLQPAYHICMQLGIKFQIEDDYLDCYGDPTAIGKVGTDIHDHKCSWLIVQALLKVNSQQRQIIETHYGHESKEDEAKIKDLYRILDLQAVYDKQEETSYQHISELIQASAKILPPSLFIPILNKIHRRQK